jgi:hypothetical protein
VRLVPSAAVLALAVAAAAGCGGGGGGSSSSTSAGGPPPAELVGTYTTTLKASDIPKPAPDELKGGAYDWKLEIAKSGGIDNAPNLTIASPAGGALESPTLSVAGDTLNLTHEECAPSGGSYTFVASAYRWQLSGKTLTLTLTTPGCPDKVAQTILASEPWTRS